ncbi:MAG: SprT family zinc-dependent metalloprotease [Bacteroidales bacterium]
MKKRTVTISSREVEIDIVRSSRRTVALYVKPGGTLLIRAPRYVPVTLLMQFVRHKTSWIERQMRRLKDVRLPGEPMLISDGSIIPYMGRLLTVRVSGGSRNTAVLTEDELHLILAGDVSQEKITALAEAWYLREAKKHFTLRTAELAALHSSLLPAPGPVNVRKMKRRWGTCHTDGAIWFNRELIKRVPELIDYVIIHELCHLVHHNHSKEYYALLGRIVPGFRELRKRLQQ